jgi:hypothetical protein
MLANCVQIEMGKIKKPIRVDNNKNIYYNVFPFFFVKTCSKSSSCFQNLHYSKIYILVKSIAC